MPLTLIVLALALAAGAGLWAVLILAAVAVLHGIALREADGREGTDDGLWPEAPGGLGRRERARQESGPTPLSGAPGPPVPQLVQPYQEGCCGMAARRAETRGAPC